MNDKKILDPLKSPRTQESNQHQRRMDTLFAEHKAARKPSPWRAPLAASLLALWTIASIGAGIAYGRTYPNPQNNASAIPATRIEIIHHHNAYRGSAFDIAQTGDSFFGNTTLEYAVQVSAEPSTDPNVQEQLKALGYLE